MTKFRSHGVFMPICLFWIGVLAMPFNHITVSSLLAATTIDQNIVLDDSASRLNRLPFFQKDGDSIIITSETKADINGIDNTEKEAEESVEEVPVNNQEKESKEKTNVQTLSREDILGPAPDVTRIISISKILWSVVFILLGFFIIKAISALLSLISEHNVRYQSYVRRILPLVKIAGWSLVFYIIISGIIQPPVETVFAFFASVGVAVGFASQDLLKNIFGGLMILFDKPFQIGDKIESGKYYGEVVEVGLRSTRIVTPDDSIVSIPNSEMMNQSISNANSSENNCQVVAEIFLAVDADTRRARQIATEAAQVSKYVYISKPIFVEFSSVLMPSGPFLKMRLKAYVMNVRYEFPFQSEMTEIVLRELQKDVT